mmetsp:Transcript_5646/g.7859  ORF Transcript_5646/g.7859 Transcript_5646/m.7859 type:complete len:630 (+) Transcript_5646:456-2345(+)
MLRSCLVQIIFVVASKLVWKEAFMPCWRNSSQIRRLKASCVLLDAANAFNNLNCDQALAEIRKLWPRGARFAFNVYKGHKVIFVSGDEVHSKTGSTQGCGIAMQMHAVGSSPMILEVKKDVPDVIQVLFADDDAGGGKIKSLKVWAEKMIELGPPRGIFAEPTKSLLVVKPEFVGQAQELFADLQIPVVSSGKHLGGCVGDEGEMLDFVKKKVARWVKCVEFLAEAARKHPHEAYTSSTKSLQSEWRFLQRLIPGSSPCFKELEDVIAYVVFIPALVGRRVSDLEKRLFALPTRFAGLGIGVPSKQAQTAHDLSVASTSMVREAIQEGRRLDVPGHRAFFGVKQREHRAAAEAEHKAELEAVLLELEPDRRMRIRAQIDSKATAWLSALPLAEHSFDLSAEQWRDRLALQVGWQLKGLPAKCDGCGEPFTTDHALCCLHGGNVKIGHDQLRDGMVDFCMKAYGNCIREPVVRAASQRAMDGENDGLIADFATRGVWERSQDYLFDTRIVHAGSPGRASRGISYSSVLNSQARLKINKYKVAAEERRATFCPLIITVDGVAHASFQAFLRRVSAQLSAKWRRPLSSVTNWVRVRMQISLIRAVDLRLRGSRLKWTSSGFEDGAGLPFLRQ